MRFHLSESSEAGRDILQVHSDVARILPNLYIGAAPRSEGDVAGLKSILDISAVLSLQTERDLDVLDLFWDDLSEWYDTLGIATRRLPIEDFSPEALIDRIDEAIVALEMLLEAGHTVYMHCTAGVNRSPTVAVAYLNQVERMPLEDALELVVQQRPQADPYEEVLTYLREGHRRHGRRPEGWSWPSDGSPQSPSRR
jgi:protein-tyrosine phosphatase